MIRALAVIPARYSSTRFPGKPLALIGGKPMLWHVYTQVKQSNLFARVFIATDDDRIAAAAVEWGAEIVMTSPDHQSGTERIGEVVEKGNNDYEVVVNIQGDEPFISTQPLKEILGIFENPEAEIGTLVQRLILPEQLTDPNTAKVVIGKNMKALYFSRSPIPFLRDVPKEDWVESHDYWKHIGIYAYRPDVLLSLIKLPASDLEKAESLEQLRWLENGYCIQVKETDYQTLSVDTPEDLEKAEAFYLERNQNKELKITA